jgi:hypothetical protein
MIFIRSFVIRYPALDAQPIADFYDRYEQVTKIQKSYDELIEKGETDLAKELYHFDNAAMVKLTKFSKALANLASVSRDVATYPTFTPDEKRKLIDGWYTQMIGIADQGNKVMIDIAKEFELRSISVSTGDASGLAVEAIEADKQSLSKEETEKYDVLEQADFGHQEIMESLRP